jgi:hypothetical protein
VTEPTDEKHFSTLRTQKLRSPVVLVSTHYRIADPRGRRLLGPSAVDLAGASVDLAGEYCCAMASRVTSSATGRFRGNRGSVPLGELIPS